MVLNSLTKALRPYIAKRLLPHLGDLPLAKVEKDTVKPLVTRMHEAGLSPKSIENYVGLVKLVVKSANENGHELFPLKSRVNGGRTSRQKW